ncbi:hypothetical protein MKW94_024046, partial [Papaver nudicaule]|nr:hypothetical protein [Papaver nudicaule]
SKPVTDESDKRTEEVLDEHVEEVEKPLLQVNNGQVVIDIAILRGDTEQQIDSIFNTVELLMEVSSNLGTQTQGKEQHMQHIFAEIIKRHEKNLTSPAGSGKGKIKESTNLLLQELNVGTAGITLDLEEGEVDSSKELVSVTRAEEVTNE